MDYSERIKQGGFVKMRRGDDWVSVMAAPAYDQNNECCGNSSTEVLWIYGTGKTGNGRTIAPMDVVNSQLMAHVDHGWKIIK